jgi:hypothetical protein
VPHQSTRRRCIKHSSAGPCQSQTGRTSTVGEPTNACAGQLPGCSGVLLCFTRSRAQSLQEVVHPKVRGGGTMHVEDTA